MNRTLFILSLLFSLLPVVGFSQNLVPNPSFEIYDSCPYPFIGEITVAKYWVNPTSYSPDYYNACDTSTPAVYSQGVPLNWIGFQSARTGVAYAGIISMIDTDGREYIQTSLTDTLLAGKSYQVSFYVSAADSTSYAANNMGVYFSKTPVSNSSSYYLPYTPQISNNPIANPLTDKYGWVEISEIFIAQGGEKYITIGNFNNDASTDTANYPNPPQWFTASYHYIDDVSVTLFTGVDETVNISGVVVFPNPSSGLFNIYLSNENLIELFVYNSLGKLVFIINNSVMPGKSNDININLSGFTNGLYLLNFKTNNFLFHQKLLLNN